GLRLALTDLSPGMVEAAVTRGRAAGHYRQVTGRVADAQALPFDDATFDVAVANHMLYHLRRDHPDVLHCTEPADVVAFLTSYPPGEHATAEQRTRLDAVVRDRIDAGGGALVVHKEVGVLLCRQPRRPQR